MCYAVAFQVWMYDYIDCTSFKFTSAANQKFIPNQVGGYTKLHGQVLKYAIINIPALRYSATHSGGYKG